MLTRHTNLFHYYTAPEGCDLSPRSGLSVQRVYTDTVDSLHTPTGATHPRSANRAPITHWSRVGLHTIGQGLIHICFSLVACCHPPDCCEFCFLFFFSLRGLFYSAAGEAELNSGASRVTERAEQLRVFVLLNFSFSYFSYVLSRCQHVSFLTWRNYVG